ncbi:MAG: lactate dehydrogenase [Planctomycetota bacterium]
MKISVIGMGRVGSATAFALVTRGVPSELICVGSTPESVEGDVVDLQHASAFIRPMRICAGTIEETAGSNIIIVAACRATDSGGDRLHAAAPNAALLREIIPPLVKASPNAIFLILSNPVDVATYVALKASRLSPRQVFGTGTLIDTGRFRALLSAETGVNAQDIRAYILGEHGESQFPALSVASAGGVKFKGGDARVQEIFEQARKAGWNVFEKKGYTNYAIAMSAMLICDAIDHDSRAIMPVSTYVDGFHGVRDVCLSLPCVIGRHGVEQVLPIDLDESETKQLRTSAAVLRKVIRQVAAT